VIALIDAGRKSATYKLATLLALIDVASENMRPSRTIGAVNATYLALPVGTRLWLREQEYEPLDPDAVRRCLNTLHAPPQAPNARPE